MDGEVKVTINYDRIAAASMPPPSKAYGFNFSNFSKFSKFLNLSLL